MTWPFNYPLPILDVPSLWRVYVDDGGTEVLHAIVYLREKPTDSSVVQEIMGFRSTATHPTVGESRWERDTQTSLPINLTGMGSSLHAMCVSELGRQYRRCWCEPSTTEADSYTCGG